MTLSRVPMVGLNRGKNTTSLNVYQPFYITPDFQIDSLSLFSKTCQFPPLNPDNKESSAKKYFLERQKKDIFISYESEIIRKYLISQ
jgi:hypothetical protein